MKNPTQVKTSIGFLDTLDINNGIRHPQRKWSMNMARLNIRNVNTKRLEVFDKKVENYVMFYSVANKNDVLKSWVGIAINSKLKLKITSSEEIYHEILTAELRKKGYDIVIVRVYTPTDDRKVLITDQC